MIDKGMLYHEAKVECFGDTFRRLVLPVSRRQAVMELAHCTSACHQSYRRTRDRIRLHFWWPTILSDCKRFCRNCEICQKTARVTVWDRVPITAVPRAQYAFQVFYTDCAGPLFPNQKTSAYNYFIVLCDSATSFPFAYPLRSLTAKNVCDAFLKTWSITGIPEVCVMDNASYFHSAIVSELMKRIGCSPRFSTPWHPQGHAPAERVICTLKQMIAKMAADHPKQWHLYLDYVLWAIRESKNESLGVAPWALVFSRVPRGILSVLKESWEGAQDPPFSLGKNVVDFMQDVKNKMETARQFAEAHDTVSQLRTTSRYNARARPKHFAIGDSVLILTPDETASRMFSKWRGPAKVIEVKSPHSYVVEYNDKRHHLHANKLKPFHTSVESVVLYNNATQNYHHDTHVGDCFGCAIVDGSDTDFGQIYMYDTVDAADIALPSIRIKPEQIEHLTPDQQQRLLIVLDSYAGCFSDDPGLCQLVEHEINITPEFRPRRLRAYRVPEKLKTLVSAEIRRLLDLGIIRPSNSEMVSPLVVVLKGKNGENGVRLAVDYSYVNRFSKLDPFPVPEIDSIVQRVSTAGLISSFDASAGYHQTRVRRGDEYLTAFVCDDGVFEFLRTPFGGKSCGATFCRAMKLALQPLHKFVDSFVDDMLVHTQGESFTTHLTHIERFLQRMREVNLTLKLQKCRFAQKQVKFCGRIIGSGAVRPDPDKVSVIMNLQPAKTKTEVRRLLGMFGFFREHIPGYAEIAKSLTDLTSKRVPTKVPWTDVHTAALQKLKQALCDASERCLFVADFKLPFNLSVDASDHSIGGYLSQFGKDGRELPLAYFSHKLSESQRTWATVHKEAFAIIHGLQKYRNWIFGCPINIYSDHNPLSFLTESAPKNSKLMRWHLALQAFDITFNFLSGKKNVAPDFLSRL